MSKHATCMTAQVLLLLTGYAFAKELKYPDGVRPGDQISGNAGEYFRYKSVLIKPPDDDDRREALQIAADIRCIACETMLQHLIGKAESHSEDHIMDQLDGELEGTVELTDNPQENRVNQNRKGCNKHFKDSLLLRGWAVQRCPEKPIVTTNTDAESDAQPAVWCLQETNGQTARDVDTYSTRNDAAFHACEQTVGRYGQEIAAFVAEQKEEGASLATILRAACHGPAKCAASGRKARRKGRRRRGARGVTSGESQDL